jgi:hypothetical protein
MQNVPKIVRQRLQAATPAINHPDADVLTAFAERSLPELERASVLEHLARCGDCRDIVALALPAMEPVETGVSRSPSRSPSGWLTWPALRWGFVAAGVIAVASFGVLQHQRRFQPETVASKQTAPLQVAANEPKKQALDRFVEIAPAAKDKLQSPSPPAFTDSVHGAAGAVDEKKTEARSEASPARVLSQSPEGGSNSSHGAAVGGALPHGPRLANQWQLQNNAQNQAPVPAPPSAYSKQQSAVADLSANVRVPAASETVEAAGEAPAIATQAQNFEAGKVRDLPPAPPPSGEGAASAQFYRAKPAGPLASRTDAGVNNQPNQDLALRGLKTQGGPGQMGGYVVDSTGAVVSSARITITPANAGGIATAVTDSQGAWLIAGLPTGNYKAQAEAPGFKTTILDFNYDANQPTMYSFTLSPGNASETVEVAAGAAGVQTETATIGGLATSREISQIPLKGRNVAQLSALSVPRWTISAAGGLQRSFDQGNTWQTVDVNANAATFTGATSVAVVARNSGAKAAKETANEKDADKARKPDAAPLTFRAVAAAGSDVWAGGSAGALYHSQDAGNHWTRIVPASAGTSLTGDIISLRFPDPQHGMLSTSTSEVWTTSDAGQTWQKR